MPTSIMAGSSRFIGRGALEIMTSSPGFKKLGEQNLKRTPQPGLKEAKAVLQVVERIYARAAK